MSVEGWKLRRLDEIGEICSGSTPSTNNLSYWDGDITWVTPNDLSKLNTPYLITSSKKITQQGLKSCSAQIVPIGSIILSSRAPIGYLAISLVDCCTNQGCKSFNLNPEYDSEFVYYNLKYNINKIKNLGEGTTFAEISKTALSKIQISFLENKQEQTQIATILSTIDRAIEQTEALIAKQQRIKTGLMQDLLTKGIDENGNIRSEETHKFKDSPLGRIPVEWEVKKIGEISTISYGISDAIEQSRNSGILTVTLPCVLSSGELIVKPELLAYSDENKVKQSDLLKKGDLLFNWRNGSQNHLGKTAYFNLEEKYTHVGFPLKIRTSPRLCDSRFLWYLLCDIKEKGFFQTAKIQVNNTFNSNELRKVVLFFPRIDEQKIIVKFLDSIQFAISNQSEYLTKLKSIKFGLMQDLLTGKVRVIELIKERETDNL